MKPATKKQITLPGWILKNVDIRKEYVTDIQKAELAVALSRWNVLKKTGGPFGAAIFDAKSNTIVSVGVNTVVSQNCSILHAEILAIILAQEKLKRYRLNMTGSNTYVLASSAQPCAMCFGAILWAGISKLIYSVDRNDVIRYVGFDEGPLLRNWVGEYKKRSIDVVSGVLSDEANAVLKLYKELNGIVY